jgi:hypothetical protein
VNTVVRRAAERLPRGIWSSTVIGMSAASVGWLLSGLLPALTTSYTRLDQLTALVLGATIGAALLGAREYRQRRGVLLGLFAGVLLGGVGALVGASVLAFAHNAIAPKWFVAERTASWMFSAGGAAALLSLFVARRQRMWIREAVILAMIGGASSGAILSLPGYSDVWQAVACIWFGAAIGFAVAGPELWHAFAVVEMAPVRGERWNPVLTREWPLHDGLSLELGEARVACQDGLVAIYPPAGGLVANGHSVRQPRFLWDNALVIVGRARYHVQMLRHG